MAGDEHQKERVESVRQTIALLETSLRLCREHLRQLETGERDRDSHLKHLFFRPEPSQEHPQSRQ